MFSNVHVVSSGYLSVFTVTTTSCPAQVVGDELGTLLPVGDDDVGEAVGPNSLLTNNNLFGEPGRTSVSASGVAISFSKLGIEAS